MEAKRQLQSMSIVEIAELTQMEILLNVITLILNIQLKHMTHITTVIMLGQHYRVIREHGTQEVVVAMILQSQQQVQVKQQHIKQQKQLVKN